MPLTEVGSYWKQESESAFYLYLICLCMCLFCGRWLGTKQIQRGKRIIGDSNLETNWSFVRRRKERKWFWKMMQQRGFSRVRKHPKTGTYFDMIKHVSRTITHDQNTFFLNIMVWNTKKTTKHESKWSVGLPTGIFGQAGSGYNGVRYHARRLKGHALAPFCLGQKG